MDSFVNIKNVEKKSPDKPGNRNDLINSSIFVKKICLKNSKYKLVRLTCEGDLHDPKFPLKLNTILSKLKVILSNGKNLIKVTKVEPWNSVRVTLNLSDDAAQQLRHLAEHGDENLREIGILSVQLDGQQIIPLNLPNQNAISIQDNERRNNNNNNNNVFDIENNNHDNNNNNNTNFKFGEDNFDRGRVIDSASITKNAESRTTTTSKQQFNRINGAAILVDGNSENSDTTTSGSSESGSSGNGSMIMMDVDNNNNNDSNNVPVNQPNPLNPFSNQKSSTTTMLTTATTTTNDTSIGCTDNLHQHGSHQTSSSCKNESLIQNHSFPPNNNNNNLNNTSDVQKSQWSTATTPSKESPSSTVQGLSKLRISCLDQQQQSTDACASTSSGTTSNPSTMIRTNISAETSNSSSNVVMINNNANMQSSNKSSTQKLVPNPSLNSSNQMDQSSVNNNVLSQQQRQTSESNTVDMINNNDSLIYQRNSSSYYSTQHQPRPHQQQQQQQNVLPNQTNVTTNTPNDILGSSIDAVDDDLLTSVVTAGGAGDPDDFQELNDINLSWLDIDNNANNSNQNLSLTSTSNSTTTTLSPPSISAISNEISSVQMNPTTSIGTNLIRIHQPQQENKAANNFIQSQYFLQNQQNQSFQQPQGLSTKMVTNTNLMGNQNQSSILINNNNAIVQASSVLSATQSTNNNNNINQSDTSISSGNTTSATIFPFTSSTTMLPNSGIRLQQQSLQHHQQMSSSPRHIFVPARTQQSWPTVNNNNNINTASQQQQQASMAASTSSNADLNITQSSTPHQQSATRFVTINSSGNCLIRQQQQSLSTNNNVTPNRQHIQQQSQQIMIRTSGIGNQQSLNTSNNSGQQQQQQNTVALSSPLLVNLLQSDVTTSSSSNNPSFQSSQQQQQFINQTSQSGTRQIRLITHNSGGDHLHQHSDGGNNTQVMTQLMMVQVSSSGGHQGQILNPITVQVPTNTQTSSSSQQQQQRLIDPNMIQMATTTTNNGSDSNDNNNNNNNNNNANAAKIKPAKKQRKPRKSKNQIENNNTNTMRVADSSVQTTSGGENLNQSIQQQQVNIGNNLNTNLDMPTTTYITVPTNSMAQSIVKFHQQQTTSSNNNNIMQQAVLSSPNSGVNVPIFNQNKRVQPVVMIAANPSQIDHQNSSNPATAQSQSIVSSAGGTFFINVPVSSMMNANNSSSSMITSSPTSASNIGNSSLQLGGNRKQIFLATKSNSFPVSSARAVARFANSPSSSTSSPVKLIPQQQQQQSASNNNSLTMSPNELRNISAPATPQSQQQVNLLQSSSTPNKSSPSPVPLASPIQATPTSISINHANLIPNSPSSSSSSSSSTSSSTTNNVNLFVNPQQQNQNNNSTNNNSILQSPTSGIGVSMSSATASPIRSKSAMEQYLFSPSQTNSNNQQQQQANFNPQFKTFQIPKTGPSSLLNKLNQTNQQQQILATKIQTVNMATNTSGKIPQLKQLQQLPVSIQQIKQLSTRISNANDESNNNNIDQTSFVVKQPQLIEAPTAVANSVSNFVEKVPQQQQLQQQQQQQQQQNSNLNSISNYKKSLAEMLANTGEANTTTSNIGGVSTQKIVGVDAVFMDNNNDSGRISEPAAPISPSYFLAPASAFDIQTKSEQPTPEIKNDGKSEQRENSLEQQSKSGNLQIEPASSETNDSSDTTSSAASTSFSLTSIGSCSGITNTISTTNSNNESNNPSSTAPTSSTSLMSTTSTTTSLSMPSKKNSHSFDSFAQDLPDHILDDDDDEEDGSDSDDDEFCFYSNRKSHLLSGSIGSIRANAPKKSEPNPTTTSAATNTIESTVTTTTASKSTISSSSSQHQSGAGINVNVNSTDNVIPSQKIEPIFDSNSSLKNEMETEERTSKIIKDNSSQCNVANGDLSSQSSLSSQNFEDDIKSNKNIENDKKPQPKMMINPTPPSSSAPMSSSHIPIITITTKSENVDENTLILKAENVLSSVKDEMKDSKVSPSQIEMPLSLNKPPELVTAKKRRISPPVGGSIDIGSNQLATKPRRKSLEKLPSDFPSNKSSFSGAKQQSSLLIQTSPDMQIMNNPNLEKSYSTSTIPTISIQNNEESPNKKQIFFTVKHPQTGSAHGNIQISNANKTLTKYLTSTESSSSTASNTVTAVVVSSSSLLPSSSSTSTTAQSTISSQNSKLFVITNGGSNNLVYRVPTQGRQVVFFKPSGNSVTASSNSIKLISNKLQTIGASNAGGQGASQPLFIPIPTSTTSTTLINNNSQQQQAAKVISVKTNNPVTTVGSLTQILTSNDVLSSGVVNNKLINEQQQQQKTAIEVKKVVRSGSLPNVPIGQLKTQNISISTSAHEEIHSSGNSTSGIVNTKTINIESNDSCNSNISSVEDVSKKTEGNIQSSISQSQLISKSESQMKKINENSEKSSSYDVINLETDSSSNKNEKVDRKQKAIIVLNQNSSAGDPSVRLNTITSTSIAQSQSIQRTVRVMSPSGNDSKVMGIQILKADGSRIPVTATTPTKDNITKELIVVGGSDNNSRSISPNNGNRKQIVITKSVPISISQLQHQQIMQHDSPSSTTIFATKSSNNTMATKTLPSILRQSKRKSDNLFPNAAQSTQSISITMDPPTNISNKAEVNDSSEIESAESSSSASTIQFQQQQLRKFPSLLSNNEDESISDLSDSTAVVTTRPKKRARKSKVTPIQQFGSVGTTNTGTVFMNVSENVSFGQNETSEENDSETTHSGNSRVLRNSSSTPTIQASKRVQRNRQQQQQQIPSPTNTTVRLIPNESFQTATSTFISTAAESPSPNSDEKTKKVRKVNTTTSRPTRSRTKKLSEADSPANSSDQMISPTNTTETLVVSSQDTGTVYQTTGSSGNLNLPISTIITSDGSVVAASTAPRPTSNCIGRTATIPSSYQQIIVSHSGGSEHYVSLLDNSNITPNNPSSTISSNNNNSLLVKRPRKSLQPSSSSTTTGTLRPMLRNTSAESIPSATSPPSTTGIVAPSPNKRRRIAAKDVAK